MSSKDSFNKFLPQVGMPVVSCLAAFFIGTLNKHTLWTSLVANMAFTAFITGFLFGLRG